MKTINHFRIGFMAALLILSVSFLNGQPRPGIECGCDKYDDYVEPASKAIKVEQGTTVQEVSSSKGKYTVEVVDAIPPNVVNITIFLEGRMIFNESNLATGWGFSPDEDRFVMHGLDQFQNTGALLSILILIPPGTENKL